nr:zinc finger, CCHC-type [Tanacetum cinerariifolium]
MADENPIRTLGDYSKPSHEGYRYTIELLAGNNVDPSQRGRMLLSDSLLNSFHLEAKLRNNILMFQQHHGESLSEAWARFKDLLWKVPRHGIDHWLQVKIFYDRIDHTLKRTMDYSAKGRQRKMSAEKAWATIEELARYEEEGWNDPISPGEGSLDYKNPDIK